MDEELNSAQVHVNEMIRRNEPKLRELEFMAEKYPEDTQRCVELKTLLEELRILRVKINRISK